jgi:hypothetical protein
LAEPIHNADVLVREPKMMAIAGTVTMKATSTAFTAHPHFPLYWSSIFTRGDAAPSPPFSMSLCALC